MKNSFLTLFTLLFTTFVFAQKDLYLTLGLNRPSVRTNISNADFKYKSDYFIGIRTHILRKEKFSLATEVQYSRKGWRLGGVNTDKQTLKYIDGIHTFIYKPNKSFNIYGGINTGFLLNNNSIGFNKLVDLGLVSGVSVGNKFVEFFGHYNYGLIKNEISLTNPQRFGMMNNQNLQLGFRFSLLEDKIIKPKEPKKIELKDTTKIKIVPKEKIQIDKTKKLHERRRVSKDFIKAREFGITSSDLASFDVLYKKRIEENIYLRYDFEFFNINLKNLESNDKNFSGSFQLGYGEESRKQIDKFELLYGWMYRAGFEYVHDEYINFKPFVGYLLGVQYNYKTNWNFGMELVPGLSLDILRLENKTSTVNADFLFSNSPKFFITYKLMDK